MSPDELAAFVTARIQIAANIEHQLLSAYAALERRELYETDGCKSLGDWIQTHSYCEHHTATEQARVAAALTDLPHIRAAYEAGLFHFDQVRQLAKFVTADGDAEWAERAVGMTPHQLASRPASPQVPP